jgi:molybdopterin adenylyltransferase
MTRCGFRYSLDKGAAMLPSQELRIGVVTVSDRASRGEYPDRGGPAVLDYLQQVIVSPWTEESRIIPDEIEVVQQTLIDLVDQQHCSLVITTGGTGPALRDITPEATVAVSQKILPGFGEQMRQVSCQKVPTAILSRQTAGIRDRCLIVNLPGNPKAIAECLDVVFPAIPDCLHQVGAPRLETNRRRFEAYRHD